MNNETITFGSPLQESVQVSNQTLNSNLKVTGQKVSMSNVEADNMHVEAGNIKAEKLKSTGTSFFAAVDPSNEEGAAMLAFLRGRFNSSENGESLGL